MIEYLYKNATGFLTTCSRGYIFLTWLNIEWAHFIAKGNIFRGNALSPSQTYTATAVRPLRDWQFSPIVEVATRSPIGPGEVAEKSATSRGPRCDQISRSQVFWTCTKTWLRLIWSQTGPGEVADQSPISRRLVADRLPTNFVRFGAWLSLRLVGDRSATGRWSVGD